MTEPKTAPTRSAASKRPMRRPSLRPSSDDLPPTSREFEPSYRGGSGTPLVLLHGATAAWTTWGAVIPLLIGAHDVFAPTVIGHAGGPPATGPASPSNMADSIETQLDAAGIGQAHIVGNSMGGWLGAELASRGRARSLVALSPAGGWTSESGPAIARIFVKNRALIERGRRILPFAMRSSMLRRVAFREVAYRADRLPYDDVMLALDAILATDLDFVMGLVGHGVTANMYDDPGVPVLLTWSEHERLLPMENFGVWKSAMPHATTRTLAGVGHVPMIDDPAYVANMILEWAAEADRRAT